MSELSDTGFALLMLSLTWFASAAILLYVYYKVCQVLDRDYYRND